MKKMTICFSVMLLLSITSCDHQNPDPDDNDPQFTGLSCLMFDCTNSDWFECSNTYQPSEHNDMDWWVYVDSVMNHPMDTCSCHLAME